MQDIRTLYRERQRLNALLEPIEVIEESLATQIVVTEISGKSASKLRQDFKLVKTWYEYGLAKYDSLMWDLDRLAEDCYDGTIPE